jgi:DNA mismatch repair ATPase MutS
MNSGKFDEELKRMSEIVDTIRAGSMMLLNESFAATTEREGSEIALQITNALMERGVRVLFVTHMYEYARTIYQRKLDFAMFLQPERQSDGSRTFRIREGRPSETSFGPDLYEKIFDADRIGNHGGAEIRGTVLDSVE